MRLAVLSDIHANQEALLAVLEALRTQEKNCRKRDRKRGQVHFFCGMRETARPGLCGGCRVTGVPTARDRPA